MERTEEKTALLKNLLSSVNQCQIIFGYKTQLATENDERVQMLCEAFEAVFKHGLRQPTLPTSSLKHLTEVAGLYRLTALLPFVDDKVHEQVTTTTFWNVVKEQLSRHELERFESLRHVNTDIGRCRAWLRSALNEHMLEKYLHAIVNLDHVLEQHYECWAFMLDVEKSITLPNMAAGLSTVLFALNIDKAEFNVPSLPTSLMSITASISTDSQSEPVITMVKRKKRAAKIINFDNDNGSMITTSSQEYENELPSTEYSADNQLSIKQLIDKRALVDHWKTVKQQNTHLNETQQLAEHSTLIHQSDSIKPSLIYNPSIIDNNINSYLKNNEIVKSGKTAEVSLNKHNNNNNNNGVKINDRCYDDINIDKNNNSNERNNNHNVMINNNKVNNANPDHLHGTNKEHCADVNMGCDATSLSLSSFLTLSPIIHNNNNNIFVFDDDDEDDDEGDMKDAEKLGCDIFEAVPRNVITNKSHASKELVIGCRDVNVAQNSSDLMGNGENHHSTKRISLVPLNNNGKPYNMNIMQLMQGDNASESYGSFDSQDILYSQDEILKDVINAIQNEKHHSSPLQLSTSSSSHKFEDEDNIIFNSKNKSHLTEQNQELFNLVSSYKDKIDSLNEQLSKVAQHDDLRSKYDELLKENSILKDQMKRYLEAVKFKESPLDNEAKEIKEYEQKLLQIAEMHGELIEFNESLHKKLLSREKQMRTMHLHMQDLKRKLSSSRTSEDLCMSSLSSQLVQLIIPSAFLQGSSTGSYHVYQIYIKIRNEEWIIYRRYTEFFELNQKLKKHFKIVKQFNFPPKKTFGKMDPKLVEGRRKGLENYLRKVLSMLIDNCPQFAASPCKTTLITVMPFFSNETVQTTANTSSTWKHRFVSPTIRSDITNDSRTVSNSNYYNGL